MPKAFSITLWFDDALEAIRFLTILKLPLRNIHPESALAHSMFFFPAVGILIGFVSLWIFYLAEHAFPSRIANLFLLIAPIIISGGLHVDGFADFCDGFFGGKTKSDILRIMKDSNVGAWGALGVTLLMLVKFELLLALPEKAPYFLLAMAASRCAQVFFCFYLPYAGMGGGVSERVAGKTGLREVLGAALFLIPFIFWLRMEAIYIVGGLTLFLILLGSFYKRRIGGVTGDLLGAASELTEVCVLLIALSGAHSHV